MSEVSLKRREYDLRMAESDLMAVSEAWLNAKAAGRMNSTLELGTDEAQRKVARARNKLEATQKRLARKEVKT